MPGKGTSSENGFYPQSGQLDRQSDCRSPEPLVINDDTDELQDERLIVLPPVRTLGGSSMSTEENEQSGTGWFSASMLIVNAALGAGVLNFSSAFHQAGGVVPANIVQVVLLGFIAPALIILAYCSDWNGAKTLQEVLAYTWGKAAERTTSICIALYCFGTCITFLIIIGDQFDRVFASMYGNHFCHTWYMNRAFTTVSSSILFVLPFCYPKKIDFLKHVSSVGVVAVIYIVILIIVQYYTGDYTPGEIKTSPTEWTDIFLVVPTICFGYQCHVSVVPIYSCFRKRNLKQFSMSVSLALFVCIFTYTVAATYGYLTFGSKIRGDILLSYNAHDPSVLIAIVAISVKTYTTYPILCFCGNAAIIDMWRDFKFSRGGVNLHRDIDLRLQNRFRIISITIWFILSLVLAILMPNIGSVIKLLGSLAAVFIFAFPGICLLRISEIESDNELTRGQHRKRGSWLTWISGVFLSVGAFIFGCVITQAIQYDFIFPKIEDLPLCVP